MLFSAHSRRSAGAARQLASPSSSKHPSPLETLEPRLLFTAVPLITEFLASNDGVLDDEDGESSDWIELFNAGDTALDLDGWHLTDDAADLVQWTFPDVSLAAGQYLVVFASSKDRADSDGTELHTNFKLTAGGEFLALVEADGSTIAFEYAPQYPAQSTDVSYGLADANDANSAAFMVLPTPGAVNVVTGPIIESVTKDPPQPTATQSLVIEASVSENASNGIARVDLHFRINFDSELSVQVFDNGLGSDALAGDGIYTGIISSGLYAAGDMVRWYISAEDDNATVSRAPTFIDQSGNNQSAEYFGTVVAESITTVLPVFQWFTQDESASHTRNGTRASVFYNGRFYDNIFVRQRGGATNSSDSQKFDFNKGDKLYVSEELGSVGEINLNGNGSDGSYLRQVMGFDAHTQAGNAASAAFHTFMTVNGGFDRVGVWIEQVDDDFLDRHGYDPQGDLYKFTQRSNLNPALSDTSTGVEKKTNDTSDLSSIQALVDGLAQPTLAQRQAFIRDVIDIPQFLNYLAVRTLQQQADDVRKNFYMYVDNTPDGDGLWRIFPWDLDWTFNIVGGHDNQDSERTEHPFFGVEDFPTADGANQWNVLYEVLLETTEIQEMYLRHVRTLMDEFYGGVSGGTTWFANYVNTNFPDIDPHLGSSVTNSKNALLGDIQERRSELYITYTNNIPGYSVAIPGAQAASPVLTIGTIEFAPQGDQDQEYIELINSSAVAIDISGWTIEGALTHTFAPGTAIAAGQTLYITPSVSAFRARPTGPSGGQSLFTQQWDSGHLSSFGETVTIKRTDGSIAASKTYQGDPTPEQEHLRITEVHFNPVGPSASELAAGFTDGDQFEFIELLNTSATQTLNLNGVSFSDGVGGMGFVGASAPVFDVTFTTGVGGFIFATNPFNGTTQTNVATGARDPIGGVGGGGALRVNLESADSGPDHGPSSGGYSKQFTLVSAGQITIDFDYRFLFEGGFESDEIGQAIAEIDGQRIGSATDGSLVSFIGDGNSGPPSDTGFVSFSTTLQLSAGTHTLTLGAYYNKSTFDGEGVTAWFDNVAVEGSTAPIDLAPGERALLVSDLAAFTERYGQGVVDGVAAIVQYTGNLANSGEHLKLNDGNGSTILDFTYEDGTGIGEEDWPTAPDGAGPSLVVIDSQGDYNAGTNWQASTTTHGTPGSAETNGLAGDVNGDGFVGAADLDQILATWGDAAGSSTEAGQADLDQSGTVGSGDLALVIANFGNGSPPAQPTSNPNAPGDAGNGAGNNNNSAPTRPNRPVERPTRPARPNNNAHPTRPGQGTNTPAPTAPTRPARAESPAAQSAPNALALAKPLPQTEPAVKLLPPTRPRFDALELRKK